MAVRPVIPMIIRISILTTKDNQTDGDNNGNPGNSNPGDNKFNNNNSDDNSKAKNKDI